MSLTVYAVSGAPRAWRVLIGLTLKQLDFDLRYLQASKQEHKSPEFLALNPRGTVPVLEAEGLVLSDSIAILAWLDRRYPEHPLFGASPIDAGGIWQLVLEMSDYLRNAINDVFAPILVKGRSVAEMPEDERVSLVEAVAGLKSECTRFEKLLADGPFLGGEAPSAAEAIAFPEIRLIERAVDTKHGDMVALGLADFDAQFPNLAAWKGRVGNIPGMDRTMPPHWSAQG